jgi:hypothetical protein
VVEPKVKGHSKLERLVLIPDRPGRDGRQMKTPKSTWTLNNSAKRKESLGSKRQRVEQQSQPGRFPEERNRQGDLIPHEGESEQDALDLCTCIF